MRDFWKLRVRAAVLVLAGCGGGYAPPPAEVLVEEGPVRIVREAFLVPGEAAPPNPLTGAAAPAPYNAVTVVRYRVESDPPRPARAIALLMPGFLGGAGSFDPLARALVRRSAEDGGGALEAWAIDRRPNLLEDHHGLDVAEVRRDPELARGYYFDGQTVEGRAFADFPAAEQVSYLSEWGLAITLSDVRRVVALVPEAERKGRLFLVGHSLGASIVEEYAAWDFAGRPGYEDLAGLVLVDGVAQVEGQAAPALSQQEYEQGGSSMGPLPRPGLQAVRKDSPYTTLPLLGAAVYPTTAITAMDAQWKPEEIRKDPRRDQVLSLLLSVSQLPAMTNRAALGFAFDRRYCGLTFAAVRAGAASGGKVEPYQNPFFGGTLLRPTDPSATYRWIEFDQADPPGNTDLSELASSWFQGPGLDFAEWYFATRLPLDVTAAATLTLKATDWPVERYGLRAIHGQRMDLPILALAAELVGDEKAYQPLRRLLAQTPIGPGRPLAGTARDDDRAFRVVVDSDLTHIDALAGSDRPDQSPSKARRWYDTLASWMRVHAASGGVVVRRQAAADPH